jgi:DNA recombination protein RmuC
METGIIIAVVSAFVFLALFLWKSREASSKSQLSALNSAELSALRGVLEEKRKEAEVLREEVKELNHLLSDARQSVAEVQASNRSLQEKLETQKKEVEEMGKRFNTEFENIANKILETKSEKFTEINKNNLNSILEPLGKNITEFKKQVEDVYVKESRERFSLGERVKELASLNKVISDEARNLTKALKGEAKTQGRWGEMILEKILEMSGLRKNEEYFMEEQLVDDSGKPLISDTGNKKMRPDAIVKYPDDRNVIIDSKVSLNAFTRYLSATDPDEQKAELHSHVAAVKERIVELNKRGYDDYNKALDFVMMFIPSEPAYNAALQADPDIWNYAYDKRILLLSPTNLITSLKLIVDLWKREYQNRNALEIAQRGARMYDKFVGFVSNLESVGDSISKAQQRYEDAYKQLATGNDNLVRQATKLKELGLKTKKELNPEMVSASATGIIEE